MIGAMEYWRKKAGILEGWNNGILGKIQKRRNPLFNQYSNIDEFVKSRKELMLVIPAKAGIQ